MLTSANKIGYAKQFLMQLVQTVRWHKTMLQLKIPLRFMLIELSASFFFTVILLLLVVLLPNNNNNDNYKIIKHFLIKKNVNMRKEFDYSSAEISCALFCRRRWKIWFHFWFPDFINPKGPQTCTPSHKAGACTRAHRLLAQWHVHVQRAKPSPRLQAYWWTSTSNMLLHWFFIIAIPRTVALVARHQDVRT